MYTRGTHRHSPRPLPPVARPLALGLCLLMGALAHSQDAHSQDAAGQSDRAAHRSRRGPGIYQPPTSRPTAKAVPVAAEDAPPVDEAIVVEGDPLVAPPSIVRVAHRTITIVEDANDLPASPTEHPRMVPRPVPRMLAVPPGEIIYEDEPFVEPSYDPVVACDGLGCDGLGCDGLGCDSPGYLHGPTGCDSGTCGSCEQCCRTGLLPLFGLCDDAWFGRAEYLYWSRRGQDFPSLAVNSTPNPDVVLFGGSYGEDGESGGRFSIGRWLDRCRTQSIEVRGWGLAEESFGYSISGTPGFDVGRPFINDAGATTLLNVIQNATPNASEFLDIGFNSEVYGADAIVHQVLARGLGGRVDMVYGYQYLRLSESLAIRSQSVSDASAIPPNAQLNVADMFDVENEYHAGHFGLATHYREGCWTFDGLAKLGLGGISRRASLAGETRTLIGAPPAAVADEGLLVTDSNAGSTTDTTFAVSPEINLGLGYRLSSHMDVTFGYTYLMVTDALQVWRTIDTTVDAADDRPSRNFSYGDFWVQGIHLGLNLNY